MRLVGRGIARAEEFVKRHEPLASRPRRRVRRGDTEGVRHIGPAFVVWENRTFRRELNSLSPEDEHKRNLHAVVGRFFGPRVVVFDRLPIKAPSLSVAVKIKRVDIFRLQDPAQIERHSGVRDAELFGVV